MSSVSSVGSTLNFTGLASGIDTSSIISGLTQLNQQHIQDLQSQVDDITLHQTTFSALESKMVNLQSQVQQVSRSVAGAFDGRTATTSDPTILTAAASSSALLGNYTIQVQALAQAQQLASSGVSDPAATIQQGTVQIQVGNGAVTTVTIDGTNNNLQGLATAINNADGDVNATVINDGSSTPYRLLLTSTKSGAANTIQVTNNLTNGTGADINLTQSTVQAAADAQVILGNGSGALTVTSPTNQMDDLISGVTVNLVKANPGVAETLAIAPDTATADKALQNFVASYNAVIDYITSQDSYDTSTGKAGVLLGNGDVTNLENALASALNTSVGGVNANANNLAQIGITFTDDGHLSLDDTKVQQALSGQIPGISAADFKNLFALTGTSTSPGVSFVLGSNNTKPTTGTPYQVDVTRAATAAQITAGTALASSITLNSTNNTVQILLNGLTSSLLTLDPGNYSPTQLGTALQTKINSDSALLGNQVAVSVDGNGNLSLRSLQVGSASALSFAAGTALGAGGPLGFTGQETTVGQDVAGQFIVNGKTETATGTGQLLIGDTGNANTDGLEVRVTLNPDQVTSGTEADLTLNQGLGNRLNQVLNGYLDPVTGRFKSINDAYQQQADDIQQTITTQNDLLSQKTSQLQDEFTQMETTISNLKATSSQLAAQFGMPSSMATSSSGSTA